MKQKIKTVQIKIPDNFTRSLRVDSYIAETLNLFSRSQVRRRVQSVLVNETRVKLSKRLLPGDLLEVHYTDPPDLDISPEAIDLDILFEDQNVLVINKPQGMVVHPGCGNYSGTLVNAVLHYCSQLKEEFADDRIRAGIVHRLDKDTSGVIIVAKNQESREFLAGQFQSGRIKKQYLAVVNGSFPQNEGKIETRIHRDPHHRKRFTCSNSTPASFTAGKKAVTYYRVLKALSGYSFISLKPKTGRTHQLRVHMAYMGCPIVGDPIYGRRAPLNSRKAHQQMMLHAYRLTILLPGEQSLKTFRAPLPQRFQDLIRSFRASL